MLYQHHLYLYWVAARTHTVEEGIEEERTVGVAGRQGLPIVFCQLLAQRSTIFGGAGRIAVSSPEGVVVSQEEVGTEEENTAMAVEVGILEEKLVTYRQRHRYD